MRHRPYVFRCYAKTESAGINDIQSKIYSKRVYLRWDIIGLKGCASMSESNRPIYLYKPASHIGVGAVVGAGGGRRVGQQGPSPPIILKMVCGPTMPLH